MKLKEHLIVYKFCFSVLETAYFANFVLTSKTFGHLLLCFYKFIKTKKCNSYIDIFRLQN